MPSFTFQIANLQASGPTVEVLISPSRSLTEILKNKKQAIPQPIKVLAMIDTGSTISVLKSDIIEKSELNPIGTMNLKTPSTTTPVKCYQYQAAISFPNNVTIETTELIGAPLQGQHIQCLIGRDILKHSVLIYNGYAQIITLSL